MRQSTILPGDEQTFVTAPAKETYRTTNLASVSLVFVFALAFSTVLGQSVGIGTSSPDPSARLHISATNKGVLIPNIGISSLTNSSPISSSPAIGLLIFNDGSGGIIPRGFYWWDGVKWRNLIDSVSVKGPLVGYGTPTNPISLQSGTSVGDILIWDGSQWIIENAPFDSVCNNVFTNYITKWTGTELCNSIIYDDGTRIGIGTTTPTLKVEIYGHLGLDNTVSVNNETGLYLFEERNNPTESLGSGNPSGNNKGWVILSAGPNSSIPRTLRLQYWDGSNWNFRVTIDSLGRVGIGTLYPSSLLELKGGGLELNDTFGIAWNSVPPYNSGAVTLDAARIYYGSVPQWTSNPNLDFLILEKTDGNNLFPDGGVLFVNRGNSGQRKLAMAIRGNGNVGINTINPTAKLEVVSDSVYFTSSSASKTFRTYSTGLVDSTNQSISLASHGILTSTGRKTWLHLVAIKDSNSVLAIDTETWVGMSYGSVNSIDLNSGIYTKTGTNIGIVMNKSNPALLSGVAIGRPILSRDPTGGFGTFLVFGGIGLNTDPFVLVRYNSSADVSALRLYLEDNNDAQQTFEIWGRSCAVTGGCGDILNSSRIFVFATDGNAYKPGGGSWAALSDKKTKNVIGTFKDGLNIIEKIQPVIYKYKEEYYPSSPEYIGVVAQELQKIAPYMVHKTIVYKVGNISDTVLTVDPSAFTYILINAVKELKVQNEQMKQIIENQQKRIANLEKELKMLQEHVATMNKQADIR